MNDREWYYSPDHGQLYQVIETQTLWGDNVLDKSIVYFYNNEVLQMGP